MMPISSVAMLPSMALITHLAGIAQWFINNSSGYHPAARKQHSKRNPLVPLILEALMATVALWDVSTGSGHHTVAPSPRKSPSQVKPLAH